MVRQPAVFLMDEPLSNLDVALRISMRAELKHLHQEMRTTFVYVTHDQAEALTLADRIVVMKEGQIQQVGTPEEVYDRPSCPLRRFWAIPRSITWKARSRTNGRAGFLPREPAHQPAGRKTQR